MEELIERKKDENEIRTMSPLTWAYIGDCIYELYIRTELINKTRLKPHMLHIQTIKYVKATAQAEILKRIEEYLTEEEKDIVRRGRNTQYHHLPKHTTVETYSYATAFEALVGYLYLTKQDARLKELLLKIGLDVK